MRRTFAIAAFVAALAGAPAAQATGYLYTYVGQDFGAANDGKNRLDGATRLTISFYVAALPDTGTYAPDTGIFDDLVMSDGARTIGVGEGSVMATSFVRFGADGAVLDWTIAELAGRDRPFTICCTIGDVPVMYSYDLSGATDASITTNGFYDIGDDSGYAYTNRAPGIWTVRLADAPPAVPEPASWAMLVAGFALVGSVLRRRSAPPTSARPPAISAHVAGSGTGAFGLTRAPETTWR